MADDEPVIFISYSHADERWVDPLRTHLGSVTRKTRFRAWHDRAIDYGEKWQPAIDAAMARAKLAILVVSAHFLNSDFIRDHELPVLLAARDEGRLKILCLLVDACAWKSHDWLAELQMLPRDGKSVNVDFRDTAATVFTEAALWVQEHLGEAPLAPVTRRPARVDISRLPETGTLLFGREQAMALLNTAWADEQTNVLVLKAWGGVGKSMLVRTWCAELETVGWRGARRVYAWSFYSQGSGKQVTAADEFIAAALRWFGDPDPQKGTPWERGERLAELVRTERTLLLLDGMEPLQEGAEAGPERGRVKDQALRALLLELARENAGLVVVTTREPVTDLRDGPAAATAAGRVRHENLDVISAEAGRYLLEAHEVRGTPAELEAAVAAFGCQALAVRLLAAYLRGTPGAHVRNAAAIPALDVPEEQGRHARRVVAALARQLGDGPETDVLRMVGLFDRPAETAELAVLRAEPAVRGLNEHVCSESGRVWQTALVRLRKEGLLAPESRHRPGAADAHPHVREHFAALLREEAPDAWREGHRRLYEYLKRSAKEFPDTLAEMAPLLAAVRHGCAAGLHQNALDVFWRRVRRQSVFYTWRQLGAFGADLAAVSHFFDATWHRPVSTIAAKEQADACNWAGFALRALGRLSEAIAPTQAGLERSIAQEDWLGAAWDAGNLSELLITLGQLGDAEARAREAVAHADRSGDPSRRMASRTQLADAVHQRGRLGEAAALFAEAERLLVEDDPSHPLLFTYAGYVYCDLLLERSEAAEAQRRAELTLLWHGREGWLLDIALDHLALGRARLALAQDAAGRTAAAAELDRAVDGLRASGQQDDLPRGLLARAECHRLSGDRARAQRDLDEARALCERCGMKLFLADVHLEQARLHLAFGDPERTRPEYERARTLVAEMGYHRRDPEVSALAEALGEVN